MNIADFKQLLLAQQNATLQFVLPDGGLVPSHFHVTEVGRIDKSFIDCGGTRRSISTCQLQLWTADDIDHRLAAGKLAKIIDLAEPIIGDWQLPVEVEYGQLYSAIYSVSTCSLVFGTLRIELAGKQTDCLAKEKCGVGDGAKGCC